MKWITTTIDCTIAPTTGDPPPPCRWRVSRASPRRFAWGGSDSWGPKSTYPQQLVSPLISGHFILKMFEMQFFYALRKKIGTEIPTYPNFWGGGSTPAVFQSAEVLTPRPPIGNAPGGCRDSPGGSELNPAALVMLNLAALMITENFATRSDCRVRRCVSVRDGIPAPPVERLRQHCF